MQQALERSCLLMLMDCSLSEQQEARQHAALRKRCSVNTQTQQ